MQSAEPAGSVTFCRQSLSSIAPSTQKGMDPAAVGRTTYAEMLAWIELKRRYDDVQRGSTKNVGIYLSRLGSTSSELRVSG